MNPCPDCKGCALSKTRKQMVESKGATPADVLFVIECPSMSDEITGKLLSGPEGRTLVRICFDAGKLAEVTNYTVHIVPMVFCRPIDKTSGDTREPKPAEILSCMRNVAAVLRQVRPKMTVLVGSVVADYYRKELPESVSILAPWILNRQPARYATNMRNLAEGLKKYVKGR